MRPGRSWAAGSAKFESRLGHSTHEQGGVFASYNFYDEIPSEGNENARINLWLFRGRGPTDGKTVEVIIKRFEFVPAP